MRGHPMRRSVRTATVLVAAAGSLLATSTSASAHYVYEKGRVYQTEPLCIDDRAEISHGDGGGFSKVDNTTMTRLFIVGTGQWVQCGIHKLRPAGYMANRKWLV